MKKFISVFLTLAMLVSIMAMFGAAVYASESEQVSVKVGDTAVKMSWTGELWLATA